MRRNQHRHCHQTDQNCCDEYYGSFKSFHCFISFSDCFVYSNILTYQHCESQERFPSTFPGFGVSPKCTAFAVNPVLCASTYPCLRELAKTVIWKQKKGVGRTTPPSFYTFVSAKNQLIADNLTYRLCNTVHCRCPFHWGLGFHFLCDAHFFFHVSNQFLRTAFRCFLDFFKVI